MHKKTVPLYFIVSLFFVNALYPFQTLLDLQEYAAQYPENVVSDNVDWLDPHYIAFYKKNVPSFFGRLLRSLKIVHPLWDIESFKKLLTDVTTLRQTQKLSGRLVAHRKCQENDQFVIVGDLYGAYHSLIRDLTWWKEQGIVDNELHIVKDHYYFIFNGNQINRSAYSIETLQVILLLMQRNPDKVFYLRGMQEDHNYWRNFALKFQLDVQVENEYGDIVVLEDLLTHFFDTLPLALYLSTDDASHDVICFIPQGKTQEIDTRFFGNLFLNTPMNSTAYYDVQNKLATAGPLIDTRALFKTENWVEGLRSLNGLGLLDQDEGSSAWAIFSSPSVIHQNVFKFFYDAFAILTINKPLINSTITLYHESLKTLSEGFKKVGTFNIVSGATEGMPGFSLSPKKQFLIGSTMSLERGVPLMGKFTESGMLMRVNEENSKGGVDDYLMRVIVYNDDYVPFIARRNIETFMNQYKISLVLLPVGSPTLEGYLDFIKEGKVSVLFPISGSPSFRQPDLKDIINMRASYMDEVRALMEHMMHEYGVKKFAFFYQDDAFGTGAFNTAKEFLKEHGITTCIEVPYTRGAVDLSSQAKIINDAQPDAIAFFSVSQETQNLLLKIGIENLANKQLFGISFVATESFRQFLLHYNLNVVFGAVVPNPRTSDLDIVKEYRQALSNNNDPYPDVFSLEAYSATSLLIEILKKLKPPFTKERIMQECESLKNYNFKGIELSFDAKQRTLAQNVWIETGPDAEWKKVKIKR